jgi:outer membrane lipoprotein-sorting protein
LHKTFRLQVEQIARWVALAALLVTVPACAVRRTTRTHPSQVPAPALEASVAELVEKIQNLSASVQTINATVDMEPTAGSIYSGVIKEYHDVKGFVLVQRPALIRLMGQAPVVRTTIFDIASNGKEFRVYIPSKQKFIVGKTNLRRPAKNALENLRPQHILDALLVPPIDSAREKYFSEEAEENGRRYYVMTFLAANDEGELGLSRKVWFDRATLEIARLQYYESGGAYLEDVRYSDYQDFQGVKYPSRIELSRPAEDYRLILTILKASFNQPIEPEKFELKKPDSAQLVELSLASRPEEPRGQ